ncbi:hypothetical protein Nmel_002635, partial [Mimus melanotis]
GDTPGAGCFFLPCPSAGARCSCPWCQRSPGEHGCPRPGAVARTFPQRRGRSLLLSGTERCRSAEAGPGGSPAGLGSCCALWNSSRRASPVLLLRGSILSGLPVLCCNQGHLMFTSV